MAIKNIKGVIIPRHDTAINWSNAVNFTPGNGELIIISADNATDVARGYYLDSEGNKLTSITVNSNGVNKVCTIKPSDKVRFKFGNGKDNVNALPFQTDALQDTASGSTILIDDISPVTHEMSVKISSDTVTDLTAVKVTRYGKNLIQTNIIEVTSPTGVEDLIWQGHISVSGKLSFSLDNSEYTPKPGYSGAANFKFVFGDGTVKYLQADGQHIYLNTPSPLKKIYFLNWGRGTGVIKNIQLEIGSFETDYEPYVEPTEYTPNADGTVSGVTSLYPNTTLITDIEDVLINCEYLTKLYTEVFGSTNIKNESTNLRNGSSIGSVRAVGSKEEDSSYKLGKYSMAEGLGTQSGAKAFTILGVDKTNKTYTLDSTEGLAIGDVYSAHVLYTTGGSTQGENYGKITAINGNVVTVDNLFCDNDFATADSYTDNGFDNEKNMFRIISKPNVGTRFIADVVHSEGVSTKALSKGSHAEGKGTTAYGSWSHAEGNNTKAGYGAHAEGSGTTASGFMSHAEGNSTTSSGSNSHTEGHETIASGGNSHAEGYKTVASGGESHAEGSATKALGNKAHAEGLGTTASGDGSHAEGSGTNSSAYGSHAEGSGTTASGNGSHAEGRSTIASNDCSHAEGEGTKTSSYASHVQGRYNILDNNNYADIIGNGGSDTERSNAYTMDWNGNAWFAGDVYTKSTSGKNKDEGSKKLATEEYVNTASAVIKGKGNSSIKQNLTDTIANGVGSISLGVGSESHNANSISLGRENINYSHCGVTAGYNNIAGKEEYKGKQFGEDIARGAIAMGWENHATHAFSCVLGDHNNSSRDSQAVFGRLCADDPNALFILGNGTSIDNRSNAYTVDGEGNGCFTGNVYVGSSKKDGKRLATEEYIDKKIEVSDTTPIEEENKIWLKPIIAVNNSEYIIEEGTNGIWTYRMWNNGISECWGKQSISVTTSTSNNGYYTGSVGSLQYPSNLFISEPVLNCTLKASSFPGHLFIDGTESSSYTGTISIAAHSKTTVNGYIHLSVKGRWK